MQPNRKDMKRIVKWFIWILTIVTLLYVGTGLLLFYHVCTTHVYETPWGKINVDTARIGFLEYWGHEPCYEAHREITSEDTIRYYFFKARSIYYKAEHDSTGKLQIRLFYPYQKYKDGEICTEHFRKEDIFIR